MLNLTGNNTYTGGTAVLGGTLAVNGSVAGNVAVGAAGTLGGNGTIGGNVVNAGTLAPGNSIGTLNVNGNFVQAAGSTYQVEANAAGQADRINVGGAGGDIQGGTVQVLAQPGSYANSTTYTILRATGGVTGTYSGVTSNFAFLTPTLTYDANDVFLTLSLGQTAFTPSFLALTPNQRAVGVALNQSFATASGDFAAVLGVIAGLNTVAGPAGAEHDQRRALCRLRHHEHQQQHDVHERAGPADGQRARRRRAPASARRWPRPARSRAATAWAR